MQHVPSPAVGDPCLAVCPCRGGVVGAAWNRLGVGELLKRADTWLLGTSDLYPVGLHGPQLPPELGPFLIGATEEASN